MRAISSHAGRLLSGLSRRRHSREPPHLRRQTQVPRPLRCGGATRRRPLGYRARLIIFDGYSLLARTRGRWSLRALLAPTAGRLSFALSALSASASALVPPPVAAFLSSAAQLTSEALAGATTSVCGSASLALLAAAFAPLPLATLAMLAVADNVSFLAFLRLVQEGIEPNPGEASTRSGASASGTSGSTASSRLRRRRPAPARSPSPTASQMKAAAVDRPAASSLPSLGACLNAIGLSSFTYDVAPDGNCLFHALAHQLGYANGLARPGAINVVYQNDAAQRELRRMAHTAVAAHPEWDDSKGESWNTTLNSILGGNGDSWQRSRGGAGAVNFAPRGVAIYTGRDVIIFSKRDGLLPRADLFPSDPAWRMTVNKEAVGEVGKPDYKPPRTLIGSVFLPITDIGALKAWLDNGTPLPAAGDGPQPVKSQQPPLVIVHNGHVHYHSTVPRAPGRDEMVVPESPPPSPLAAAPVSSRRRPASHSFRRRSRRRRRLSSSRWRRNQPRRDPVVLRRRRRRRLAARAGPRPPRPRG